MPEVVGTYRSTISETENPYLNGPWEPTVVEWNAGDLPITGQVPTDLDGIYVRNGHNPLHQPLGRYHPFDGDGMLHSITFNEGRVSYRNRYIRTKGFESECAAGKGLYYGRIDSNRAARGQGYGAQGGLKDNSGTDVLLHHGQLMTLLAQCGEPYRIDARSLQTLGVEDWGGKISPQGVSAHAHVDEHTGELMFFNYATEPPYMNYGVVSAESELVHYIPVDLPGPRLPHDMQITERYSILHDLPLVWESSLLSRGVHKVVFNRDQPARFGILPRFGGNQEVRWFDASPCYLLHTTNAYEDGDEVVMDGVIIWDPVPDSASDAPPGYARMLAFMDGMRQGKQMYRWRFNLVTGETKEQVIDDVPSEFPTCSGAHWGRPYRYSYNLLPSGGYSTYQGIARYDMQTGEKVTFDLGEGRYASEVGVAPRVGSTVESDAYIVTLVTDVQADKSECLVFDASDLKAGPITSVTLPQRISLGSHATWAPAHLTAAKS